MLSESKELLPLYQTIRFLHFLQLGFDRSQLSVLKFALIALCFPVFTTKIIKLMFLYLIMYS